MTPTTFALTFTNGTLSIDKQETPDLNAPIINPADRGVLGPNAGTEWKPRLSRPQSYTGYGARSTTVATPQTQPIPGKEAVMAPNHGGGYSFLVEDMTQFERFLILGTIGGSYYASEHAMTKDNLEALTRLVKNGQGEQALDALIDVSHKGRAVSNDPALFALAYLCANGLRSTRRRAYESLPKVARTGTHLFHFLAYVKQFRGRGSLHRNAMKQWYTEKPLRDLVYQAVKYQQRDGWSQRDILRLTRPKPKNAEYDALYHWIATGDYQYNGTLFQVNHSRDLGEQNPLRLLWAMDAAKQVTVPENMATLIKLVDMPREAVPTEMLRHPVVWRALLEKMPLEALMRNLATMTRNGTLTPGSAWTTDVCIRLANQAYITASRLHPMKILVAQRTYASGKSAKGDTTWTPIPQIVQALNTAFYLAFGNVTPTGKHLMLALDLSASMTWTHMGHMGGITPREAAAAMALVTANREPNAQIVGFSDGLTPLTISPDMQLPAVVSYINQQRAGYTDCSLPMQYALQKRLNIDTFVVYTDNETNSNSMHPSQALKVYQRQMKESAKLAVVAMTATKFSIAEPNNPSMLDVTGFDTSTPEVLAQFSLL